MKSLKILTYIIFTFATISCGTTGRLINSHIMDFRPYWEHGFNIYTGECLSNHSQLGIIQVDITPGIVKVEKKAQQSNFEDPVYSGVGLNKFEALGDHDLLDPVVAIAKEMGGNGIAHLEVKFDGTRYHIKGTAILIERTAVATKIHD